MSTYKCYIKGVRVGVVEADGSLEARVKAREKFGEDAESEWNAWK